MRTLITNLVGGTFNKLTQNLAHYFNNLKFKTILYKVYIEIKKSHNY